MAEEVRHRAGNACEYCRMPQSFYPTVPFPIDHIIARQHGGRTVSSNLALSCLHWNSAKRNVTDIPAALREAHRVLKRGGRFYVLEFSTSEWPGFGELYDRYSEHLIPRIGKAVAKDEESYRYLVESIRRFPRMDAFRKMIEQAGFRSTSVEPILGGLVAIHGGWKI